MNDEAKSIEFRRQKIAALGQHLDAMAKAMSEESLRRQGFTGDFLNPVETGWLKLARTALQLSNRAAARQIGITSGTYARIEKREVLGSLTLKTLQSAANCLDCELVYFIRPISGTFAEKIWNAVVDRAANQPRVMNARPNDRDAVLVNVVAEEIKKPGTRRALGWSQRQRPR